MVTDDPKPIFDGVEDERLLDALYQRIARKTQGLQRAHADAQRIFFLAWQASGMLSGDGFELMLEQEFSLEDFSEALVKIGMPQVKPIFDRVIALIPAELRRPENQEALFAHLHGLFDELKGLLYEYFAASKDVISIISRYVREHPNDFAKYAEG